MRTVVQMPYHIGLKVKLYPSTEQKRLIAVNASVARAVYNHLVACSNEKYHLSKYAANVPVYQERISYLVSVTGEAKKYQKCTSVFV